MFFDAPPRFEQQLPISGFHPFSGNWGRSDFLKGRNRQSLKGIQVRQSEFFAQARGVFHCVRGAKSSCFVDPLQRGMRAGGVLAPQSVRLLQPGQVGCDHGSFLRGGAKFALIERGDVTASMQLQEMFHSGSLKMDGNPGPGSSGCSIDQKPPQMKRVSTNRSEARSRRFPS